MNDVQVEPRRLRVRRLLIVLVAVAACIAVVVALVVHANARAEESASSGGSASSTSRPSAGASDLAWPRDGVAAVAVGDEDPVASSGRAMPMASMSKVVTALMVLEERPLAPGEAGGDFWFTEKWEREYRDYLARGESALKIPVDGMLTQRQLLQGMLIGSACNYADILVESVWGDDASFARAAAAFLDARGIEGATMSEPTGIDPSNTATAAAMVEVGRLALADPVVAEIVAMTSVELPGAGLVENTNDLLADPGVVGIKTGTLEGSSLLSAKDVDADGSMVRVIAVVMGQPDDEARFTASRALYRSVEQRLAG